MTRAAAFALERAAAASPNADALYDVLPAHLQRLVACGPVFVAAVDPSTLHFVREVRLDISDEAASQFLAHEVGVPDVVKFRALAVSDDPVDTLFRATDRAPASSARWREVIEPLGWGDELRVAIRDRGRTWGVLCLHRVASESPFDDNDVAAVRQVVPQLAAAFRRTALASSPSDDTAHPPGVVVLDDQFVVTSLNDAAATWLDLLGAAGNGLPIVVMSVAARTVTSSHPQSVAAVARDGRWLGIHASPLHGQGPDAVVVVIQPAHPGDAFAALAAAAQLTARETDVAAAAFRGLSDRAIARSLGLSEYTVQDHLKRVYGKTGARGRADLIARLTAC
jgi:DNA-binding CsgD family transcriptional regulator